MDIHHELSRYDGKRLIKIDAKLYCVDGYGNSTKISHLYYACCFFMVETVVLK